MLDFSMSFWGHRHSSAQRPTYLSKNTYGLSHLMLSSYCTRTFTPTTFIVRLAFDVSMRTSPSRFAIVAFDVIRGTELAAFLSCAVLLRDDRCAAVQPSSAAVDPVTVGICHVALHPALLNCSNRSSDVSIEFSRTCSM